MITAGSVEWLSAIESSTLVINWSRRRPVVRLRRPIHRLDRLGVRLRMEGERLGRRHSHRAVDEDTKTAETAASTRSLSLAKILLGSTDRKRRDDHLALETDRPVDDAEQFLGPVTFVGTAAVTVGGLHDEVIGRRHGLGLTEETRVVHSKVAGEDEPALVGAGTDPEVDNRGAEDMTGRHESDRSGAVEVVWLVELDGLDLIQYRERVLLGIERRDPAGVLPLLLKPLDLPLGVVFLDPAESESRILSKRAVGSVVRIGPR